MDPILTQSIVLARIIGLFFLVCGVSVLYNRSSWIEAIGSLQEAPATINFIALAELAVGLVIVFLHPHFAMNWPVILTIIGVLMIAESSLYLIFISQNAARSVLAYINNPLCYNICGIVALFLGFILLLVSY